MAQIRSFGQGAQIDQVKNAYTQASSDGKIDRQEFMGIASELNDVWKINQGELMSWLGNQDPQLANSLRRGMAANSAQQGWADYSSY